MMSAALEPVQYATPETSAALNLNPRQIAFVNHYLECRVAWKAAELAGYAGNRDTLNAVACENLRKPSIKAYYLERLQSLQIDADETLAEVGAIARSPWDRHVEVKHSETGEVIKAQLKLSDKLKALELAGKYHRLFTDRVETEVDLSPQATERLSQSLCAGLIEAARQYREQQSSVVVAEIPDSEPASD